MAFDPIVGRALSVLLEHARLADRAAVVEGALEDDVAKSFDQGAVRIAFAIGEGVVLPMAGDPFLGDDRRSEPEPEPHGKRGEVVQPHAAVGLRAMQEQRDTHVRDVTRDRMKRTGIHHRAAHTPKPGIAELRKSGRDVRTAEPLQFKPTEGPLPSETIPTRAHSPLGLGRAPLEWAERSRHRSRPAARPPAGAIAPDVIRRVQVGNARVGPQSDANDRTAARGSSPRNDPLRVQISTGSRTSCVGASLNLSRIVTGNGMLVTRRKCDLDDVLDRSAWRIVDAVDGDVEHVGAVEERVPEPGQILRPTRSRRSERSLRASDA